nr:hypothetical protein BaRGS_018309 [Batillaria attramentaria]
MKLKQEIRQQHLSAHKTSVLVMLKNPQTLKNCLIPKKAQHGLLMQCDLILTCIDADEHFIALGTNIGLTFLYNRKDQSMQRLKAELQKFEVKSVHRHYVTCVEWSTNGMKLYSGDKTGHVVCTEVDFYQGQCKSLELLVEPPTEVVQLHYDHKVLLVSTKLRSFVCRLDTTYEISQIGQKDRKVQNRLGGIVGVAVTSGEIFVLRRHAEDSVIRIAENPENIHHTGKDSDRDSDNISQSSFSSQVSGDGKTDVAYQGHTEQAEQAPVCDDEQVSEVLRRAEEALSSVGKVLKGGATGSRATMESPEDILQASLKDREPATQSSIVNAKDKVQLVESENSRTLTVESSEQLPVNKPVTSVDVENSNTQAEGHCKPAPENLPVAAVVTRDTKSRDADKGAGEEASKAAVHSSVETLQTGEEQLAAAEKTLLGMKKAGSRVPREDSADDFYALFSAPYSPTDVFESPMFAQKEDKPDASNPTRGADRQLSVGSGGSDSDRSVLEASFRRLANSWSEFTTPANIYSLALSQTHVWFTDKSDNLYYSAFGGAKGILWRKVVRVKKVMARFGVVWVITESLKLLVRTGITADVPQGLEWREVNRQIEPFLFSSCSVDNEGIGWGMDVLGQIWFTDKVTPTHPVGSGHWWQVPLSEYFVQDPTMLDMIRSIASKFDPQKLTYIMSTTRGGLIVAGEQGVWLAMDYQNTLHVCRGSLQGMAWAQQVNGELYAIRPDSSDASLVVSPLFVSVGVNEHSVWGLTENGEVHVRTGMGPHCPLGAAWAPLDLTQLGDAYLVYMPGQLNPVWLPIDTYSEIVFTKVVNGPIDWMLTFKRNLKMHLFSQF